MDYLIASTKDIFSENGYEIMYGKNGNRYYVAAGFIDENGVRSSKIKQFNDRNEAQKLYLEMVSDILSCCYSTKDRLQKLN